MAIGARKTVGLMMFGLLAGVGRTQRATTPQQPQLPSSATTSSGFPDGSVSKKDPRAEEAAARQGLARNDDRQRRLVADTDKLLTLATQLHEDVGKTDKNVLSLDVIKRADEIEKLAHAVKERMKG